MIIKTILYVIFIIFLVVAGFYIYYLFPGEEVELVVEENNQSIKEFIDYGTTPVLYENLRFKESRISYFIENTCSKKRKDSVKEAFSIFEDKVGNINFYEVNFEGAEIRVRCSNEEIELEDSLVAAGEGGPSTIIDNGEFKVIENANILLYKDQKCDKPVVEIHEIGHVLGFNHSSNENNIMYPVSKCGQELDSNTIRILRELYAIESLGDAYIEYLSARKSGSRLDFDIVVKNIGLKKIDNLKLEIEANGRMIKEIDLDDLEVGYSRTLNATNLRLFSRNIKEINFVLDKDNLIREINEENNIKTVKVSS